RHRATEDRGWTTIFVLFVFNRRSSILDIQSLCLRVSVAEDWLLLKPRMTWYHSSAGGSNGIRKPGSRNGSVLRHWMGDVKAACRPRLRPPSCSPARGQAPRARLGSFTPNGPKHRRPGRRSDAAVGEEEAGFGARVPQGDSAAPGQQCGGRHGRTDRGATAGAHHEADRAQHHGSDRALV